MENVAFSDKTAAVMPVIDTPGPREMAHVISAPEKWILVLSVSFSILCIRA